MAETVSQNLSQISLNSNEDTKPKLKSILGAGAGPLKQKHALPVSQDTSEIWTEKNKKRYDLNTWRQQLEVETERPPPVIERVAPTPAQPITVRVKSEVKEDPDRNRQRN